MSAVWNFRSVAAITLWAATWVAPRTATAEEPIATDAGWRRLVEWPRPSVVQDIAQMPSGHLLFSGVTGLVRFDGNTFAEVPVPGTRSVRRVLAARDGAIWAALGAASMGRVTPWPGRLNVGFREGNGGLVRIHGTRVQPILPADGSPQNWVWALTETDDHQVWIGTEAGLFRVSARTPFSVDAVPLVVDVGAQQPLVTAIEPGPSPDTLWIGSSQGLFLLKGASAEKRWSTPVIAFAAYKGTAFVADEKDIISVDAKARASASLHLPDCDPPVALTSDGAGGVWCASSQNLVHRSVSGAIEVLPIGNGIEPTAMLLDRENSVWVGTSGVGLVQARPTGIRNHWMDNGLDGDVAFSVLRAPDDSMLVRTNLGLVRMGGKGKRFFAYGPDFPAYSPGPIALFGDTIWVGSSRLFRSHGEGFTPVGPGSGDSNRVRSILIDHQGGLWTGGRSDGVILHPTGDWESSGVTLDADKGLCDGYIAHLAEAADGIVWGAGNRGLSRIENGHGQCFSDDDGFLTKDLTSVTPTSDGRLWITGIGAIGLYLFEKSKIIGFDESSGVPTGSYFFSVDDQRGGLWLTSDHGVFRVNREALLRWTHGGAPVDVLRYDASNGLRSEYALAAFPPGAALAKDGTLWVPTLGGISLVAPPERQPRPVATAVVDRILVDGVVQPSGEETPQIRSDAKNIEFQFAAPSFLGLRPQRFEHRLLGMQSTWSRPTEARSAYFGHLAPGRYQFELRLAGQAHGVATLPFTIIPRFFQTRWFRVAAISTAFLIAFLLHRLRVARISARFELIQRERARIARELHDGLAQIFLGLGFHLDGLRIALGDEAPAPILKLADDARGLLDKAQSETRRAVWTLRAEMGEDGLRRSLRRIGDEASRALGVRIEVNTGKHVPPASGLLEHEIPAIAREAITNAVNHGKAKVVTVDLEFDDAGLLLKIVDDGVGLSEPGGIGSGFGLVGMQERAHRMGADLSIEPAAGRGTVVRLWIPSASLKERIS